MEPDGFRDRNHRYGYLVACENARRITGDPEVLEAARRHLDRFSRDDPARRGGFAPWSALLDGSPGLVAVRLTERGERGDYTRETAPSAKALPSMRRSAITPTASGTAPPAFRRIGRAVPLASTP